MTEANEFHTVTLDVEGSISIQWTIKNQQRDYGETNILSTMFSSKDYYE